MKNNIYIVIIVLIFLGCNQKSNPLIGTWIEKNNFQNPLIFKIDEDCYQYLYNRDTNRNLCKVKAEHFLFSYYNKLEVLKYEVNDNEFYLKELGSDSILQHYMRNDFANYMEFINSEKGISINLPQVENGHFFWSKFDNSIFLDYDIKNNLRIFINGELTTIDSNLYIKLYNCSKVDEYIIPTTVLFVDSLIALKDYNKVTFALSKAQLRNIVNVSLSKSNKMVGIYNNLKPYRGSLPDSIKSILKPIPPKEPINFNDFANNNLVCSVSSSHLEVNNKTCSINDLLEQLENQILANNKTMLNIHFEDELNYGDYLTIMSQIKNVYYNLRKVYSIQNFGEEDINNLVSQDRNKLRKIYPMRINTIDKLEYNKLIKYAL